MSSNIIPISPDNPSNLPVESADAGLPTAHAGGAPPEPKTSPIVRTFAAIRRFQWLILALAAVGLAAGIAVARVQQPSWQASSQVWIQTNEANNAGRGPATQSGQLLAATAWTELLVTPRVVDSVVVELGLFAEAESSADTALVGSLRINPARGLRPGDYKLTVNADGRTWSLAVDGTQLEAGAVGDSIGRVSGFLWRPPVAQLTPGRTASFTVLTPREASMNLQKRLTHQLRDNFLALTFTDRHPQRAALILNTWVEKFVATSNELKRAKLTQASNILQEQLIEARADRDTKAGAVANYRIATVTLPREEVPIPGSAETQTSVIGRYSGMRLQASDIARERGELERVLQTVTSTGTINAANNYRLNVAAATHNAPALASAVSRFTELQTEIRGALAVFADSAPQLNLRRQARDSLVRGVIPRELQGVVTVLRNREQQLGSQIAAEGRELQQIPARAATLQNLALQADIAEGLYRNIEVETQAAGLAALSTTPDLEVLSLAEIPSQPTGNTTIAIILGGLGAGLGLGILIAMLIDRVDRRFRYPEQAKDDLGLDILGTVPELAAARKGRNDPEEAAQVVESFRLLRLNVGQALGAVSPMTFSVTSPQAGDGKSLVSSNLALSFAEAGYRTVLVDGDIRRGVLHDSFGVEQKPGLLEYLMGGPTRADVLRDTTHPNLTILPCGTRSRRGPELLSSEKLPALLTALRSTFDVIIIDSPPLSAGIDPFAIGVATGAMVIVLRSGKTDMRLAQNKLGVVDRLPIGIVGAVLNGIRAEGAYKYYSYDYGYADQDEPADGPVEDVRALEPGELEEVHSR